jgi:hypothetical protein
MAIERGPAQPPALRELTTTAISNTLGVTATAVFVYDTRKDSDGGAWRKRTQHTSWYNETLGTATRGVRRDFPAVAVIVGSSAGLTIYDGDDPDLPMWMVFNASSSYPIENAAANSITAINGTIFTGANTGTANSNLSELCFIHDACRLHQESAINQTKGSWASAISGRNNGSGAWLYSAPIHIKSTLFDRYTNAVAATVLPGAPIDSVTGLPIPTLAIAHAAGIVIVHNNGSIVRVYETGGPNSVWRLWFRKDGKLAVATSGTPGIVDWFQHYAFYLPYQTVSTGYFYQMNGLLSGYEMHGGTWDNPSLGSRGSQNNGNDLSGITENATGHDGGLNLFYPNNESIANDMAAFITSKYNTGWLHSNIQTSLLNSNTAETIVSPELISNSTFDANVTGWTAGGSGASISWNAAGRINVVTGTDAWGGAYTTVQVVAGKTYVITGTITDNGGGWAGISGSYSGGNHPSKVFNGALPSATSYYFTHTATQTGTLYITIDHSNTTSTNTIVADNISVRLAEVDRSYNNKGAQIVGTITKSAVDTGSELVAYSGFSASNYIQQPYVSTLDFGTGDFSFGAWVYPVDITSTYGNQAIFVRSSASGATKALGVYMENDKWAIFVGSGSNTQATMTYNMWQQVFVVRRNGIVTFYLNGVPAGTSFPASITTDFSDTTAVLRIGGLPSGGLPSGANNKVALIRYSSSAISEPQLKKMYYDEKQLFQPGAQACLYGSSDAVTALTYDDTTQLLHVGTSAGRSVFEGLRRVDNTTVAVATSISASNGLVAEQ